MFDLSRCACNVVCSFCLGVLAMLYVRFVWVCSQCCMFDLSRCARNVVCSFYLGVLAMLYVPFV